MSSTLAGEGVGPLLSSLRSLFSQSSLKVSLSGLTEAERGRDIAFYDETLVAAIRLSIPASEKTVPAPTSTSSQTTFSLPITTSTEEEEDGSIEGPPKLLSLLISSTQVSLDASYTAPRLGGTLTSTTNSNLPESSTSSHYLIPATNEKDAAYQNVPLQQDGNNGEVTQAFDTFWSGNKIPADRDAGKNDSTKIKEIDGRDAEGPKTGGEIWYVEGKGKAKGAWVVEWRCKLPIIFIRTRHPTPALLLTATMTLRLQPSQLSRLAPTSLSSSASASESLYMHDLLNPLSEGPSYPDESPAERAARANASLAKLPLGKLPSSILGSKLVTPARNAREVSNIIAKKRVTENGDMGDAKEGTIYSNRRGGRSILTNEGLMAYKVDMEGGMTALSQEEGKGLGEEIVVLQRSARRVVDVQSAILVRMRTITVPDFQVDGQVDDEDSLLPSLILCVEIENPINSGMKYSLDRVEVSVNSAPSTASTSRVDERNSIEVSMQRVGDFLEPSLIDQGTQLNLLYQASFDCPMYGHDSDENLLKALLESHRNVSIKLLGRPVLLRSHEGKVESYTPTEKFVSTWTCTLDLSPQMRMLVLRKIMHNGAGSNRFRARSQIISAPPPRSISTAASRPIQSVGQLPASPHSALSQTPSDLRTASNLMAPIQISRASSTRSRPSLRSASGPHNDSFVSLQRSESDAQEVTSPALPSALVGHSILARARLSRSSTMSTNRGEDSRQLLTNKVSYDRDLRSRHASDTTMTPTQRRITGPSMRMRATSDAAGLDREFDRGSLLPLGDKRCSSVVQRLLFSPNSEEGVLIDIVANSTQVQLEGGQREASIQVQIENRSDRTRTLILSWRLPSARSESSIWSTILIEDDDVQVGPLHYRDSEVATLKLYFTKSGLQPLPPLAVYDTSSGVEKILQDLQTIVVT